METREIRIDQALFGYREGHRLLRASRKFVPTTERSLLVLTDMSGPRMVEGFDEYLSGYPVPGEKAYTLVKTWYAPEMERPGCVWSHALIIQNSDVREIAELSYLFGLFRRPQYGDADYLAYYIHAASLSRSSVREAAPNFSISEAQAVLAPLYGKEDRSVVIPSPDSRLFEDLVLGVWSQQWPALRVAFRFCTGSLSNRTFTGQVFDLQVVPQKLLSELRRDPTAHILQPVRSAGDLPKAGPWVHAGAVDLVGPEHPFRDFAWRYADTCRGQRSLYSKLGELFVYLKELSPKLSESDLPDIDRRVSGLFPEPSCGMALKREFFGDAVNSRLEGCAVGEEARLRQIARTDNWRSYDALDLRLRERGRRFWTTERGRSKAFFIELLDSPTNSLADEIIAGCVDEITISEVGEIVKQRTGLLLALISRNPRLILSSEFWQCPIHVQAYYSILDFLASSQDVTLRPAEWIPFLIKSGNDQLARPLVERFAADVIKTFADGELVEGGTPWRLVSPSWREALSEHQSELVSFLAREEYRISSHAMVFMAGLLDPHQPQLREVGLGPWIRVVKEAADMVLTFPNGEAASFLLSLGFQHSENDAVILVAACFEHVHTAARDDALEPLSYRAWKYLEEDVPTLGYFKNWDRCERLRRALIGRFVDRNWPREQFLRCVKQLSTLESIFYSCREVRGGEDFMRGIATDVLNGSLTATESQRSVFRSKFRLSRRGLLKLELL